MPLLPSSNIRLSHCLELVPYSGMYTATSDGLNHISKHGSKIVHMDKVRDALIKITNLI